MSAKAIARIEKTRGQKLSEAETARLRSIGEALNLREDDALWNVLAAMEYQRAFYEALPDKITAKSAELMQGMAIAAEKETAAAQAKLADSVVKQAEWLAGKFHPRVRRVTWLGTEQTPGAFGATPMQFCPVTLVRRWAGAPPMRMVKQPTS
jgi:hypothetical protein